MIKNAYGADNKRLGYSLQSSSRFSSVLRYLVLRSFLFSIC